MSISPQFLKGGRKWLAPSAGPPGFQNHRLPGLLLGNPSETLRLHQQCGLVDPGEEESAYRAMESQAPGKQEELHLLTENNLFSLRPLPRDGKNPLANCYHSDTCRNLTEFTLGIPVRAVGFRLYRQPRKVVHHYEKTAPLEAIRRRVRTRGYGSRRLNPSVRVWRIRVGIGRAASSRFRAVPAGPNGRRRR